MGSWIKECHLKGDVVELLPLTEQHRQPLIDAASDGELWNLWYTGVPSVDSIDEYISKAQQMRQSNGDLAFVIKHIKSNKIIGSSRYCHVDNSNKRLEIGFTWYAKSAQRSAVNTESKLLLLTHAFESLDAIAVEFRTHFMNQASRRAILRLGAKQDGVLRNHQQLADGSFRDTVVYSIINSEWPAVKNNLTYRLQR